MSNSLFESVRRFLAASCPENADVDGLQKLMKPLNVFSRSNEEIGRLMSNFAPTKFTLDGLEFGSIEAFYVYLLFLEEDKREKVRPLYGIVAKRMGKSSRLERTCYRGEEFDLGSETHFGLIKRAIRAKLKAHPVIADAFVATALARSFTIAVVRSRKTPNFPHRSSVPF
jgi:predicted NAD-dependent protein-ADP-ribosyltransferase YbiA (DUF1768 family)